MTGVSVLLLALLASAGICADETKVASRLEAAGAMGHDAVDAVVRELDGALGAPAAAGPTAEHEPHERAARLAQGLALRCEWERRASATPAPRVTVDRGRLEEIFSRPEFAQARSRGEGRGPSFREWLEWLFASSGAQSFSVAYRFFVLLAVGLLLLFGLWRLAKVRGWLSQRPRRTGAPPEGRSAPPLTLEASGVHLARARAAQASLPREAIREALFALLSALERHRFARPDRVRTNRELAAELPSRGAPAPLATRVDALIGWYDQTFYSLTAVPPDEAQRFVEQVAALESELTGGAR